MGGSASRKLAVIASLAFTQTSLQCTNAESYDPGMLSPSREHNCGALKDVT